MSTPESPPPFALREPSRSARGVIASYLAALSIVGLAGLILSRRIALDGVVPEVDYAVFELVEAVLWIATVGAAAIAAWRQRMWRGVLLAMWLGALGFLAALREMDLHVLFNATNIEKIGIDPAYAVSYRLDWWTDGSTSIAVRLVWGILLVGFLVLVCAPWAMAGYPWPSKVRNFARFAWGIGLGFGFLFLGFALDDFIGRPLNKAGGSLQLYEELAEFIGQSLVLGSTVALALNRVSLSTRSGLPPK